MHRLKEREREIITLTDEEFEDSDFTGGYIGTEWEIQNEIYKYVDEINTAAHGAKPEIEKYLRHKYLKHSE